MRILPLAVVALAASCTTPQKAAQPRHAVDCSSASLALEDTAIVGVLDGKPITAGDLGADAHKAESKALYEYCDAVSAARQSALDEYVTKHLVEKAGGEDWLQGEITKRIPQPSDADILAFYNARKRPDAPPLEDVKAQVVMLIQREKSEEVVRSIFDELKQKAKLTQSLPDVRSPARDVEITAHTARTGSATTKVHVVEFADFQCPYCSQAAATVRALKAKYGARVDFAYRNFPLRQIHPNAQHAAEVGQCALAQGKFWEMSDKMYGDQSKLDEESLKQSARDVGLDDKQLDACLTSGKAAAEVEEDFKKAEDLGVQGTPTFFVNGRQHAGDPSVEGLSAAIDAELK